MKPRHAFCRIRSRLHSPFVSFVLLSFLFIPGAFLLLGCAASIPEYDDLMARGDYGEAKEYVRTVLDEYSHRDWNPTMPARRAQLYYWLANAHAMLKEYDSLQVALSLCVSNDPGFSQIREQFLLELARSQYNEAVASYNTGSYGKARSEWNTALDLVAPIAHRPFQAQVHRHLGFVGAATTDTARGLYHLRQSAELGDTASRNLLLTYERTGRVSRPTTLPLLDDVGSLKLEPSAPASPRERESPARTDSPPSTPPNAVQVHLVGGYAVSYVGTLSATSAVRVTADLNFDSQSLEGPTESDPYYNPQNFMRSTRTSSYGADVVVSILSMTDVGANSSVYLGVGPAVRYGYSSSRDIFIEYPPTSSQGYRNESHNRMNQWGLGAGGVMGIQLTLTPAVGLLAEYQLSAVHTWRVNRLNSFFKTPYSVGSSWSTTDQKGWEIRLNSIRLGIAVLI